MPEVDVAATRAAARRLEGEAGDLRALANGDGPARVSDELAPLAGSDAVTEAAELQSALCTRLAGAAEEFDGLVAGLRTLATNVEKATG